VRDRKNYGRSGADALILYADRVVL
jgi:hypothetical protein